MVTSNLKINDNYIALDLFMLREDKKYLEKKRLENELDYRLILEREEEFKRKEYYKAIGFDRHPNKNYFIYKKDYKECTYYISISCVYLVKNGEIKKIMNLNDI